MADKSFSNELQRALARPDADALNRQIEIYHLVYRSGVEWPDALNEDMSAVMTAHWDDPDRCLAYVVLAAAMYDERDFLLFVAAGPLEDLLHDPSSEILERLISEARKTPRIRWMLIGVYLHAIADRAREAISKAIGDWTEETPLPGRPFA